MAKSKQDVTVSQAKALAKAISAILEIFRHCNFHVDGILSWYQCASWFAGYGGIRTNKKGNRKYIEVRFRMYGDPKRLWVLRVALKWTVDGAGELSPSWQPQHCTLYLPKSISPAHAWLIVNESDYDNPVQPRWLPTRMNWLLKRELYPESEAAEEETAT